MAALTYLDTHVVAWLYAGGSTALPSATAAVLEQAAELWVSPMVRLELQYLYEIGRVAEPALAVLDTLEAAMGLVTCQAPFAAVVKRAESESWTRDPFDRIIVAQAALFDASLVTKDSTIRSHYGRAVWKEDD
jgi:PIN domain nuclease of toxin-antitoxin system